MVPAGDRREFGAGGAGEQRDQTDRPGAAHKMIARRMRSFSRATVQSSFQLGNLIDPVAAGR